MELLKHFKELTLHPKNAQELKGLILQLAIQGKLTKAWRIQNPNIESASVLLDKIRSYHIDALKKSKRRVKTPKIESEATMDLPDGWVQVYNFELFNLQKGKNPKDLSESVKKYPYQDIEALDRGNVRRYSDDENILKCKNTDIVVVCDGSRSGLVLDAKEGILGSTLAIIHTPPFIKEYIKFIFLEDFERANSNMIGAAIPHLDTKKLLQTEIGLPPLEEQKVIVATVNQLFKEVEALEEQTKARVQLKEDFVTSALQQFATGDTVKEWSFLQEHFKTFFTEKTAVKKLRETILQLAVQGKLTSSWRQSHPDIESASILLEKIKAEKAQLIKEKKIKAEKPLPEITEEEIPYELPEGWVWCRVDDLKNVFLGGFAYKSNLFIDNSKYQVLRLGNVKNDLIRFHSNAVFITEDYAKESYAYKLKPDDILITMTGTRAKRDYCFTTRLTDEHFLDKELYLNQRVGCFRFNKNCSIEYINQLLKVPLILDPIFDKATGTANQANIGKGAIVEALIPLPPLKEQKAIVEKVNALMGLCDELEKEIEHSTTQVEQLMQSCLKEVFEN